MQGSNAGALKRDDGVSDPLVSPILYAAGLAPKTTTVDALRGVIPWFVPVGDCVQPRRVEEAVYSACTAAMNIF